MYEPLDEEYEELKYFSKDHDKKMCQLLSKKMGDSTESVVDFISLK